MFLFLECNPGLEQITTGSAAANSPGLGAEDWVSLIVFLVCIVYAWWVELNQFLNQLKEIWGVEQRID